MKQASQILAHKKSPAKSWTLISLAENEGFEPPVPCGTIVFKTTAFDHSANSPGQRYTFFFIHKLFFRNIEMDSVINLESCFEEFLDCLINDLE